MLTWVCDSHHSGSISSNDSEGSVHIRQDNAHQSSSDDDNDSQSVMPKVAGVLILAVVDHHLHSARMSSDRDREHCAEAENNTSNVHEDVVRSWFQRVSLSHDTGGPTQEGEVGDH